MGRNPFLPLFFLSRGKGRKNGLLQIIKPGFFGAVAVVFVALRRMGAVVLSECLAWTTREEEKAFAVVLRGRRRIQGTIRMAGGGRRRDTPPPSSSLLCCMACLLPPPSPPAAAAWNQVSPGEGFDKECLLLSLMKTMHKALLRWANFALAVLAGGTGREGRLFSRPRSGAQAWRRRKRREMEVCVLCSRGKGPPSPSLFLLFKFFVTNSGRGKEGLQQGFLLLQFYLQGHNVVALEKQEKVPEWTTRDMMQKYKNMLYETKKGEKLRRRDIFSVIGKKGMVVSTKGR